MSKSTTDMMETTVLMPTVKQTKAALIISGRTRAELAEASMIAERTLTDFLREAKGRQIKSTTILAIGHGISKIGVRLLPNEGVQLKDG